MAKDDHIVDGKLVECKRAVPKESMAKETAATAASKQTENKSPASGNPSSQEMKTKADAKDQTGEQVDHEECKEVCESAIELGIGD